MYNGKPVTLVCIVTVSLVSTLVIGKRHADTPDWNQQWPAAVNTENGTPEFSSELLSDDTDQFVHAATIVALDDGRLLSAWFGGSREGASDVKIFGDFFDPETGSWGADHVLATRSTTRQAVGRYIRKLGNPVLSLAPDGKLWFFYVSVSVGGWAGSAINASYSLDGGHSWEPPQRLITSPFFNISTLIKGTPLYYRDGSIGLPVYHEFMGKFAELLRLDANGRVIDKARITHGKHSLQPVILPSSSSESVALMRYAGEPPERMLASYSDNGGESWHSAQKTSVANSNSALAAVRTADGSILAAMNDLEDGRHRLSLMRSEDNGANWNRLALLEGEPDHNGELQPREVYAPKLERSLLDSSGPSGPELWRRYSQKLDKRVCKDAGCRFIFDYPYMIQASNGDYHLVYTWNKSFIKHLRFNQAWLDTL